MIKNNTKWVVFLLVVDAILSVARILISAKTYNWLIEFQEGLYQDMLIIDQLSKWEDIIRFAQIIVFIILGISVLIWLYQAHKNLSLLGVQHLKYSHASCVWWYFVPFANLLMPFRTMKETWQASHAPSDWFMLKTPAILRIWWGVWLLNSFLGNMVMSFNNYAQDIETVTIFLGLISVSQFVSIVLNFVFYKVIMAIDTKQRSYVQQSASTSLVS